MNQPTQQWQQQPQQQPMQPQQPVQGPQGFFTGVESANVGMQAEYLKPGTYWIKVGGCKIGRNWKHEDYAAIEGEVVRVLDNDYGRGHRMHESVTDMVKRSSMYFLSDCKAFTAAALGIDPASVTEQQVNDVYGPQQPLTAGQTVMEVVAREQMTKQQTPFTKVSWKRAVPAAELLLFLDNETRERHFPNGVLQQIANYDAGQGGQPVPPQDQWGSHATPEPVPTSPPPAAPPPQQAPPPAAPPQQWQQPQQQDFRPAPAPTPMPQPGMQPVPPQQPQQPQAPQFPQPGPAPAPAPAPAPPQGPPQRQWQPPQQ